MIARLRLSILFAALAVVAVFAQGQPAPSQIEAQKIKKLILKIDRDYAIGDFDTALKEVGELEALQPGDPAMLLRKAAVLQALDRPPEAILVLKEVLKCQGLPQSDRERIEKRIALLAKLPLKVISDPVPIIDIIDKLPGIVRIADVALSSASGKNHLKIAIRAHSGAVIDSNLIKVVVYLYETKSDGTVVGADSKVTTQWLSQPIDWANGESETCEVQYVPPKNGAASGRKYYGYTVGLYYNLELQDFRNEPKKLESVFPLPVFRKRDAQ